MACERHIDALNDAAAGASPSKELDAHLAMCANCRAQLATLRRVLAVADREMAQLATAEPSVSFVPRVRAALVQSGSASTPVRHSGWLWPSLAAAAVLVMALAVVVAHRPPRETIVAETHEPHPPAAVQVAEPARELAVASASVQGGDAPQPRRRAVRRLVHAEPEVLVPAGESQALLRLVALVNSEGLALPVLSSVDRPSAGLAEPAPIDIKPIEIVPLDPARYTGT